MENKKVFKIIGSALLAVLVLVLFVGLALAPAFSPKALSDDDMGGSDVSTYADWPEDPDSPPITTPGYSWGVWVFDDSLPISGNDIVHVANYSFLLGSGNKSSVYQYMRVETQGSLVKLYYVAPGDEDDPSAGVYVYDTTFGWVDDNFRYLSVISQTPYDDWNFVSANATKLSNNPEYGPFAPAPDPPDPGPGDDGSYDDGYDDGYSDGYDTGYDTGYNDGLDVGYDNGYDAGYNAGFNDGVLDDLKNPLVFFVGPIASFLDTPLFAGVSIGDMLALLIFIFVGLIFLRMFAGG